MRPVLPSCAVPVEEHMADVITQFLKHADQASGLKRTEFSSLIAAHRNVWPGSVPPSSLDRVDSAAPGRAWVRWSLWRGMTRVLPQHPNGGQCPQADRREPDDQAEPPRLTQARLV
jgi:hypothetical protein